MAINGQIGQLPIPVESTIQVTLQAQEWNIVMECLADGRYRVVGPVIQKMADQLQLGMQQYQQPAEPHIQPVA